MNKPEQKDIDARAQQMKALGIIKFKEPKVHAMADELLCEILTECGYSAVVEEFNKLNKWYE